MGKIPENSHNKFYLLIGAANTKCCIVIVLLIQWFSMNNLSYHKSLSVLHSLVFVCPQFLAMTKFSCKI